MSGRTAAQRRAALLRLTTPAVKPAAAGKGRAHRAAILAGAPSKLSAVGALPRGKRARAVALTREQGFIGAAIARGMGGKGVVTFAHPGATGHERCKSICVTYA